MIQTDHTAIVLRYVNYRDNDRMLTLFSPTRGKLEVMCRGCRRPKSPLLSASELFALGDFELYQKGDRLTITGFAMTEMFFPLRQDFDRLAVGTYLLNLCELAIQPGEAAQELFMLLLHTLSRLTFTNQDWRPLLAGFLLHFAACEGYQPQLEACTECGRILSPDEALFFDIRGGGLCCRACHEELLSREAVALHGKPAPAFSVRHMHRPLAAAQLRWMQHAMRAGSASWLNTPEKYAPLALLRSYVETRLDQPIRSAGMLPKED